mmetsp:Transcript_25146/g.44615  ORF Transcript_25146/g.44615 Transcript_25146/m.44615 type:complete len:95 (+) Transcript_25146:328-612(+)
MVCERINSLLTPAHGICPQTSNKLEQSYLASVKFHSNRRSWQAGSVIYFDKGQNADGGVVEVSMGQTKSVLARQPVDPYPFSPQQEFFIIAVIA